MKKLIFISMVFLGCSKAPTSTTSTKGGSGTFTFNGINYTHNFSAIIKQGNYDLIAIKKSQSSGTVTDQCEIDIAYNSVNKDSTYAFGNQMISSAMVSYMNYTQKKVGGSTTFIYEYKKSPNIVKNANGTFTINDSFKCFRLNSTYDTTRYTIYVNNVTI